MTITYEDFAKVDIRSGAFVHFFVLPYRTQCSILGQSNFIPSGEKT